MGISIRKTIYMMKSHWNIYWNFSS